MSFGRGFDVFQDDSFFSGTPAFPRMGFGFPMNPALSNQRHQRDQQVAQRRDPFESLFSFGGPGGDPFARMDAMMNQMMQSANHSSGHCYSSSSSVMHYSSGGEGRQPRMYHATSSSRQAPGGIKETRKTVRDSESGVQKMAIGHHIKERSHTVERGYNTKTKEKEEHQELINLAESDVPHFNQEWQHKSRQADAMLHPSPQPVRGLPSTSKHHSTPHTHKHHPYDMSQHSRPNRRHQSHVEPLDPGSNSHTKRRYHTHGSAQTAEQKEHDHLKEKESGEHGGKAANKQVRF